MWFLGNNAPTEPPKTPPSKSPKASQLQESPAIDRSASYSGVVDSIRRLSLQTHAWTTPSRSALNSRRISMENISMLPQPASRGGSVLRALTEVSDAEHNTRSGIPPPSSLNSLKRQASNLPEPVPAPKRKTLAERAGEIKAPSHARAASTNPQNGPSSYRTNSSLSSLSRSASTSSRATSNSSFTGSLNSGIRPPASQPTSGIGRPVSSLARAQTARMAASRPQGSLATLAASHEAHANKRKDPISSFFPPKDSQGIMLPTIHTSTFDTPSIWTPPRRPRRSARPSTPSFRDISLTTRFSKLTLELRDQNGSTSQTALYTPGRSNSPSKLPKLKTPVLLPPLTPSPKKPPSSRKRTVQKAKRYLRTDSMIENFDPDEQYQNFKRMFEDYQHMYKDNLKEMQEARNESTVFKDTITKIEQERTTQTETMISLRSENETLKYRLESLETSLAQLKKEQELQLEDLRQRQRADLETARQEQRSEIERIKLDHREEIREMKSMHQEEVEFERVQRIEALSQVSSQGVLEKQRHQMDLDKKEQEVSMVRQEIDRINSALEREKEVADDLRKGLSNAGETATTMEAARQALQAKVAYLESDSKSQSEAYAAMEKRMNEAIQKAEEIEEKLRREETLRRKLHNQVQELKGNIRVFCRVRPTLSMDEDLAKMKFPDTEESTEIEVRGQDEQSALGKNTTKTYPFTFDRVFNPENTNDHVFNEISQLIQSALDGFNVCIFAYGQTGSGKTFTMSSEDGMIPRALRQIYSTSKELEDRGWKYSMEGSFIEVYNEELRDLLSNDPPNVNKKHEIRHDMTKMETTITDTTTLTLDSQDQVEAILSQAMKRRSVAATKANEHSSRSHSVFILKLVGENSITGEKSKGTLNLVDLAGSERIRNSETSGNAARLKETQNINKSLSCLGDVIGALGQASMAAPSSGASPTFDGRSSLAQAPSNAVASHIPYRNSKLTYLLQFSLGGNSKTLMFVMVAPEKKCLGETITSLKFAEKVARTKVGVAKKVR